MIAGVGPESIELGCRADMEAFSLLGVSREDGSVGSLPKGLVSMVAGHG